jgi:hypothetical protein
MKMAQVIWEQCRRPDGSINLSKAARHTAMKITPQMDMYLSLVEAIKPVTSRQIAALSIATAAALYPLDAAPRSQEEK